MMSNNPHPNKSQMNKEPIITLHEDTTPTQTAGQKIITDERARQITVGGWTAEHDDKYAWGVLTTAAHCYRLQGDAITAGGTPWLTPPSSWPWHASWWKPSLDVIRNYAKSGALYLAEIDRAERFGQKHTVEVATRIVQELASRIDEILTDKAKLAANGWTQDEPTKPGTYWLWDGDEESAPVHIEVFWGGTDNRCFVPMGQYGWTRAQDMDELAHCWWRPIVCPELPNT